MIHYWDPVNLPTPPVRSLYRQASLPASFGALGLARGSVHPYDYYEIGDWRLRDSMSSWGARNAPCYPPMRMNERHGCGVPWAVHRERMLGRIFWDGVL